MNRGFPNLVDDIGGIATKVVSEAVAQATDIADKAQNVIDGDIPIPRLSVSAGTRKLCFEIASDKLCVDFNAVENLMLCCFALLITSSICFLAPSIFNLVVAICERLAQATIFTTAKNACQRHVPSGLVSFGRRAGVLLGPTLQTLAHVSRRICAFSRRLVSGNTLVNIWYGISTLLSAAACLVSISILGFVVSLQRLFQSAQLRLQGNLQEGPMTSYSRALVILALIHALVTFCTCVTARKRTGMATSLPSSSSVGKDVQGMDDAGELEGRFSTR